MSPPIAQTSTPIVKLAACGEKSVVFNLATFERIEKATGMTAGDLMQKLAAMSGARTADGKPDQAKILEAFSISLVSRFLAGCLGVEVDQLGTLVPLGSVLEVFGELTTGFGKAASLIYSAGASGEDESAANPPVAADGGGGA